MGQVRGLWRDTWWLWGLFVTLIVSFAIFDSIHFLLLLPILPGVFFYFAFNRYDEDGNEKSDF